MITIFIYHFVRFRCKLAHANDKREEQKNKRKTRRVNTKMILFKCATHNHQKETKILGACYTSNLEKIDDPIGEH